MTMPFRSIDVDETYDAVSTTGVRVYAIHAINISTGVLYLKLYDTGAPTVGTTTPKQTFVVPTAAASTDGGGFTLCLHGMEFPNGLAIAATTALADNSTAAPGDNALVVNIEYDSIKTTVRS